MPPSSFLPGQRRKLRAYPLLLSTVHERAASRSFGNRPPTALLPKVDALVYCRPEVRLSRLPVKGQDGARSLGQVGHRKSSQYRFLDAQFPQVFSGGMHPHPEVPDGTFFSAPQGRLALDRRQIHSDPGPHGGAQGQFLQIGALDAGRLRLLHGVDQRPHVGQ